MQLDRFRIHRSSTEPDGAAAASAAAEPAATAVDLVHSLGPVSVLQRDLLVDRDGGITEAAKLGHDAREEDVTAALQLWASVSRDQVQGYVASSRLRHRHARDLVFTTVACVAAWVKSEGFLEPWWRGPECPQQAASIQKLYNWQSSKSREVRPRIPRSMQRSHCLPATAEGCNMPCIGWK